MKTLARVAPSQATVLVFGETGTGKELVARTHPPLLRRGPTSASSRSTAPRSRKGCSRASCSATCAGAFTGAATARPGLFREADHGTLFLDEIGDISPALQARLLRALQEHEIVPVGSETAVQVDVRVLAATHRDLPELVRQGRFREDLYYRLNVVTLTLPPLRERRQDIPLLIDHFLRELASRHGRGPVAVDPEAQRRLLAYDWPGNIRELQNVLERAMLLAEQDVIGPEHLTPDGARRRRSGDGLAAGAPGRGGPGAGAPAEAGVDDRLQSLEEIDRRHVLQRADRDARQSRRDLQGPRHQPPDVEPHDPALEPAPPLRLKPLCPARDRVARHPRPPRSAAPRGALAGLSPMAYGLPFLRRSPAAARTGRPCRTPRGGNPCSITRPRFRPRRGLALRERALGPDLRGPVEADAVRREPCSHRPREGDSSKTSAMSKSSSKSMTWTTDQIKEAQEGLAKAGLYKGKPTGQFNADTRKALKKYQKQNKLPVTGRLDNEVLNKLKSA